MSAKDKIHQAVKNALIKNNWTITDDPYTLQYEDATVFVDLGAERIIAAEKSGEKIAIEIKSFVSASAIHDMEEALGQFMLYVTFLEVIEPERKLYVGISEGVYQNIFGRKSFQLLVQRNQIPLIVVNLTTEEIVKWTN